MTNDCIIRLEQRSDHQKVETLTREAFWNVYRPGCYEHYLVHQFRNRSDFVPELALVMEKAGQIIGHIMYVRSAIEITDGSNVPIMTFGPFSIAPDHQNQGCGTTLLQYSMAQAKNIGVSALAITGDIAFYGRFGFVPGDQKGIIYKDDPNAPYFLVKELTPGFLDDITGTYQDPECYFVSEAEVERFDMQFPPKEKLKLPGQLI